MSQIDLQKAVADEVLQIIENVDPTAIVAGGAPRDWYFGNAATDIDVFFHFRNDLSATRIQEILKGLGLDVCRKNEGDSLPEIYKKNPMLRCVYDLEYGGEQVQLLLMLEPTFNSVIKHFPLNICKVWYKHSTIEVTQDLLRAMKHKAIVKVNPLYANGDKYVEKIKAKFPDFNYYDSYQKLAIDLLDK